jgi:hypothetical protein
VGVDKAVLIGLHAMISNAFPFRAGRMFMDQDAPERPEWDRTTETRHGYLVPNIELHKNSRKHLEVWIDDDQRVPRIRGDEPTFQVEISGFIVPH